MLRFRTVTGLAVQWICGLFILFVASQLGHTQVVPSSGAASTRMEQIPPPRELKLALGNSIKAREDNEIAQLSLALGALMEGLARTDYLIESDLSKPSAAPNSKRRPLISMRGRVERLVGMLSMPQREAFEALYGAKATTSLDAAITSGDALAIEEVAHRWRFTEAGMEAMLLLARRRLDERRFSEASQLLSQLRESQVARKLFEPELSSLLVSAYWLSNERDEALRLVDRIADSEAWLIQRAAEPWRSAFSGADTGAQLTAILGAPSTDPPASKATWPMFLGGPQRLGLSPTSRLPESSIWRHELVGSEQLAKLINAQQQSRVTSGTKSLPAIYPTIVGDRVIIRTPERVVSYQLRDGKDVWSYPFDFRDAPTPAPAPASPQRVQGGVIRVQGIPVLGGTSSPQGAAFSKIWDNDSYGRTSANERFSFVLDGGFDLPSLSRQQQLMIFGGRGGRVGRTKPAKVYNRLTAIDLQREGAVAWVVGGETGEMNKDLKGVFFLGPPLPSHNRLYVLFERDDMVHLGVLDAQTGATEWTLRLAPIINGAAVNLQRRMLGATPSMSKGVLICPTTVNGLIAIDVARRQFLWGWAPKTTQPQSVATRNAMMAQIAIRMQTVTSRTLGWLDSPVVIREDVILHASDDEHLYCLDRKTGEQRWKRARQDTWFVGCVSADVALLIGKHRYTAVSLATGKAAWAERPFRAIPAGGIPTGRGFSDGEAYYLPTSEGLPGEQAELLRIELDTGETERLPLQHRLGNLASTGPLIISAGPDGIEALRIDHQGGAATPRSADPVTVDWSSKTVKQLVELLDADNYKTREAAMKELGKRGAKAVDGLGAVARGTSPEAARRALVVLIAIGKRGVEHPNLQAILEEAKRATNGTRGVVPSVITKRKRSIAALMSLGAKVERDGESVILMNWRGKPGDLKHLQNLPALDQLLVVRQPRGNEMIPFVSSLKSLQILTLQHSNIDDKGLAALANLPKLRHLDVSHSEITDASIPKLASFGSVKTLVVSKSKLSQAGWEQLKAALPNARVTNPR